MTTLRLAVGSLVVLTLALTNFSQVLAQDPDCAKTWTFSNTLELPADFWPPGWHNYEFQLWWPDGSSHHHMDLWVAEDAPLVQGQVVLRYWVITSAEGQLTEINPAQDTAMQVSWVLGEDRQSAEAWRAEIRARVRWDGGEWIDVPSGPLTKWCARDNPGHFQRTWGANY